MPTVIPASAAATIACVVLAAVSPRTNALTTAAIPNSSIAT